MTQEKEPLALIGYTEFMETRLKIKSRTTQWELRRSGLLGIRVVMVGGRPSITNHDADMVVEKIASGEIDISRQTILAELAR
ncbi:hypothetical protein [Ruegeria lacuscaerulensis]|uniref:hypothetical protein n=1 Tax=Ruegeria lacuscaerulensis TaxID=55218 RepID=UPI001481319E|nr:hypothetical protein [Ruegeria lacuscaerulensis]